MEFQRAWELNGFDDANSGEADDAGPIGIDDSDSGETDGTAGGDGPDAAADFGDTAEMSAVAGHRDAVPGTRDVAEPASGVAAAGAGAARPGPLATVRRALLRTKAAMVASGLAVVCLVAILIVTAWNSSGSRTPAAAEPRRAPDAPAGETTTSDGSSRSQDASGTPEQRRSVSASGSATGPATSPGSTASGRPNAAPVPQGQTGAPQAQVQQAQRISTVRITGLAGKCLGAAGGGTGNGTAVDLYSCNGAATQQWGIFSDGTIRTAGKCMAAAGGGTSDGTRVQLSDCNGDAAQQWTHTAGNDLVNPRANKCLDLKDRSSADFTVTQIWSCNGASHQKWTLS